MDVEADHQAAYARFMPLIQWLLAIPQYVFRIILVPAVIAVAIVAAFAILFKGRYPRRMWDFMVGFRRWRLRLAAYATNMTDHYPPFSLKPKPNDAIRLRIRYPDPVARWRPFVAWILILPYALIASVLTVASAALSFLAIFTILFTRRYPVRMFNFVLACHRWDVRTSTYALFLVDAYPPFRLR